MKLRLLNESNKKSRLNKFLNAMKKTMIRMANDFGMSVRFDEKEFEKETRGTTSHPEYVLKCRCRFDFSTDAAPIDPADDWEDTFAAINNSIILSLRSSKTIRPYHVNIHVNYVNSDNMLYTLVSGAHDVDEIYSDQGINSRLYEIMQVAFSDLRKD